jgi:hypothetical protein
MATFGKKPPPPVMSDEERLQESLALKEALRARILARLDQEREDTDKAEQIRLALKVK